MKNESSLPKNLKAVLFDLDGTLIDHFRVIYRCYAYALDKLGLDPVSYETVKASVGGSIVITFGKLMPQEYVERAVELFREEYDRIWHEEIIVLPQAEWILENLKQRGLKLGVFTNKEGSRSRLIIKHLQWGHLLDAVVGTLDTPHRKPQPEFTQFVLNKLGIQPEEAIMIGDSPYDVQTAKGVGMPAYVVATGSHTIQQIQNETSADGIYADLGELAKDLFDLPQPQPSIP